MKKVDISSSAGTKDESSTNAHDKQVSQPNANEMLGDVFLDALLKTLNSVYEKFRFIKNVGSIYIIGYDKDTFSFEIPKEGGDVAIIYPEKDIIVIDKKYVKPFTKKFMSKRGGWKNEYADKDWLAGHTAGCEIFATIIKSHQNIA